MFNLAAAGGDLQSPPFSQGFIIPRYNVDYWYFKVWQDGNDAQEIHTTAFLEKKMNYIHNNPIKAELVGRAEDYLYSSGRDYAREKVLVEMAMV